SRDRGEQRPDRFAVGEKIDAKVISVDRKERKVMLSIKQREIEEEKEAMAQFGTADSGASLGDILGVALSKAQKDRKEKDGDA
ncbi:MAG: S1 RNA-binding domain-containing protein, partial [Alphaproteobacteria bacterium]|nr:S1 RNA-binding domain-containing protein [Alphaproteobacteria bacterium]